MAQTWLITGSSRGLGRALAEAVLAAGHNVVATARDPRQLDDLVAAHPDRARAVALDVTDREQARQAVEAALKALRPSRRARQQRRLRQRQLDRGLRRGRLPRADRDEPVGRRSTSRARPCRRCASRAPGTSSRSRPWAGAITAPGHRPVPDREVGGRRLLRRAGQGGRAAWDQGHDHRARRLPHRLGRVLDDRPRDPRRLPADGRHDGLATASRPRRSATRSRPPPRSWRSPRSPSRRCGCCSAATRSRWRAPPTRPRSPPTRPGRT